jgi:hypothetical protein
MHDATRVVFDGIVESTDPVATTHLVTMYTSLAHTAFLAAASQLVFQVIVDVLTIRSGVPLSVTIEHSADGQNWQAKNASPEIATTVRSSGGTQMFSGGEAWPALPNQRFVRLLLAAGGSVAGFAFKVTIWAVRRTRVTRLARPPKKTRLPGDATLFGIPREVVAEFQSALRSVQDAPPGDRFEMVARRLSGRAHGELHAFRHRLSSLDRDSKIALVQAATLAIGAVMLPPPRSPDRQDRSASCGACSSDPTATELCGAGCDPRQGPSTEGRL